MTHIHRHHLRRTHTALCVPCALIYTGTVAARRPLDIRDWKGGDTSRGLNLNEGAFSVSGCPQPRGMSTSGIDQNFTHETCEPRMDYKTRTRLDLAVHQATQRREPPIVLHVQAAAEAIAMFRSA